MSANTLTHQLSTDLQPRNQADVVNQLSLATPLRIEHLWQIADGTADIEALNAMYGSDLMAICIQASSGIAAIHEPHRNAANLLVDTNGSTFIDAMSALTLSGLNGNEELASKHRQDNRGRIWSLLSKPLKQLRCDNVRSGGKQPIKVSNVATALNRDDLTNYVLSLCPHFSHSFADDEKNIAASTEWIEDAKAITSLFESLITHPSIQSLHHGDIQGLLKLCTSLRLNPHTNALITTAIGGSPDPVNARLPSYLMPALQYLEIMHEALKAGDILAMPRLRILNAMRLGALTNTNYDELDTITHGKQKGVFMRSFIEHFAPAELLPYILHQDDLDESLFAIPSANEAEAWLRDAADADTIAAIEKQCERMLRQNRIVTEGSLGTTMQYSAAHPLYFSDHFSAHNPHQPDFAITMGGYGEGFFMKIRELLVERMYRTGSTERFPRERINLITRVGTNPPYYNHQLDVPLVSMSDQPLLTEDIRTGKTMRKRKGNPLIRESWVDYGEELLPWIQKQCSLESLNQADAVYRAFCKDFADKHLTA